MNRLKREEIRKKQQIREGLSPDQLKRLDAEDENSKKIEALARKNHAKKFPEEYDFQYDSFADAKDRARGINPMSQHYIEKVKKKRVDLGVSPLSESGDSTSDDTMKMCLKEARDVIKGLNNNYLE
jgi:hypothetical protein